MHARALPFTAAVRNSSPPPCFGASHLDSATRLVWAPPVFNTCVCDLCRVRAAVSLSHLRPSVVTAPVCRGCPGPTVVRQLVLCFFSGASHTSSWKVSSLRLLDSLSHPSSTWLQLWSCRSSGNLAPPLAHCTRCHD